MTNVSKGGELRSPTGFHPRAVLGVDAAWMHAESSGVAAAVEDLGPDESRRIDALTLVLRQRRALIG